MLNFLWGTPTPASAPAPTPASAPASASAPSKPVRNYGWNYKELNDSSNPFSFKQLTYHQNLQNIKEIDNSSICPLIMNQENIGSCTSHAILYNYESQEIKQNKKNGKTENLYTPMSRLMHYYQERDLEGTTDSDSGAQIKDGMKIINEQGLCLEQLYPYMPEKFTEKPPQNCYDDLKYHKAVKIEKVKRDLRDIDQCLLDGNLVTFGFLVYESMESEECMKTGIIPMPDTKKEKLLGGHAITMASKTSVNGKVYYRLANSWGTGIGENQSGYFLMPAEYITYSSHFGFSTLCSDFWTIKLVDDEPDPNSTNEQKLSEIKKLLNVNDTITKNELCNKIKELYVTK